MQSSKFLTEKKSRELIKKLEQFVMNELVKIYGITPALASRRVCPFTDEWLKKHDEEGYKLNMKSLGVD